MRDWHLMFNFLKKLLGFDYGVFELSAGEHRVFIPTSIIPSSIWVSVKSDKVFGCCQIPKNEISYIGDCDGIIFDVSVSSGLCTVTWFATI